MNQNSSATKIRLRLQVNRNLNIVSPTNPTITSTLTAPCSATATVELCREVEWVIIDGLTVPYGLRLTGKGRSLRTAWDDTDVEVTRLREDGTEEDYWNG